MALISVLDEMIGVLDTLLLKEESHNSNSYKVIQAQCNKNDAAKIWNVVVNSSNQNMIDVAAKQNKSYIEFYDMWVNKWHERLSSKTELFYLIENGNTNYCAGYIRGGIADHSLESNQWIRPQLIIKQDWIDNLKKNIKDMVIDDPWEDTDNDEKIVDKYDAEIIHFAISNTFQRMGLGMMLYKGLVNGLREDIQFKDMRKLIVWTYDGNVKGQSFYEKKLKGTLVAKRRISENTVRCGYSLPISA